MAAFARSSPICDSPPKSERPWPSSRTGSAAVADVVSTIVERPTAERSKRHPGRGRPTIYTDELGAKICTLIATGHSLREIERQQGLPDRTTIWQWVRDRPDFASQYAAAREHQPYADSDAIRDIAVDTLAERYEVDRASAAVGAFFRAAKILEGKRKAEAPADTAGNLAEILKRIAGQLPD